MGSRLRALLLLNLAPVRTFVQVASRRQIRGVMRPSAPTESEDVGPWRRLGLSDEMHHALNGMGLREPSPIQQQAIPQLMTGENLLVASETGSGKTLGYLLPIIQALRAAEALGTVVRRTAPTRAPLAPRRAPFPHAHARDAACPDLSFSARARSRVAPGEASSCACARANTRAR